MAKKSKKTIDTLANTDPDAVATELEPIRASAESSLSMLANVPLDTPAALEWMSQVHRLVLKQYAAVEELRKTRTQPLLQRKRAVDNQFQPTLELLERCAQVCNDRLKPVAEAGLAGRRALQAGHNTPENVSQAMQGLPASHELKATPKWRIPDPAAVPREFCCPDEKQIAEYFKQYGDALRIPGVEIYYETELKVYTK